MSTDYSNLQKLLDEQMDWPAEYLFKFIAPAEKKQALVTLLTSSDLHFRESKNGKYVSVTARLMMPDSSAVIALYQKVETIEGVMAI